MNTVSTATAIYRYTWNTTIKLLLQYLDNNYSKPRAWFKFSIYNVCKFSIFISVSLVNLWNKSYMQYNGEFLYRFVPGNSTYNVFICKHFLILRNYGYTYLPNLENNIAFKLYFCLLSLPNSSSCQVKYKYIFTWKYQIGIIF